MKNNFVAKYAKKFNKSLIFKDKKKALKRGETKHAKKAMHFHKKSYQIAA